MRIRRRKEKEGERKEERTQRFIQDGENGLASRGFCTNVRAFLQEEKDRLALELGASEEKGS